MRFIKGEIYVRTKEGSNSMNKYEHFKGAIAKCYRDRDSCMYYNDSASWLMSSCRKASKEEVRAFEKGITNIADINQTQEQYKIY